MAVGQLNIYTLTIIAIIDYFHVEIGKGNLLYPSFDFFAN